jgi:hypothetical protein
LRSGMVRETSSCSWETPSWELRWDRVLKIILGQPQVLTFLGESTKSGHKTWCSSIKHIIFGNVVQRHTPKPPSTYGRWRTIETPIDSGIGLSIRIDNLRCLSIKGYELTVLSTNYW